MEETNILKINDDDVNELVLFRLESSITRNNTLLGESVRI